MLTKLSSGHKAFLLVTVVLLSMWPAMASYPAMAANPATPLPLIPMPASVVPGEGGHVVTAGTPLRYHDERSAAASRYFSGLLERSVGLQLIPSRAPSGSSVPGIDFMLVDGFPVEGYRLVVDEERITITAADERGLFYGAVTLWQLIAAGEGDARVVPALEIEDAPRFGWRGYMLDSARNFHSVVEIKRVFVAMALH